MCWATHAGDLRFQPLPSVVWGFTRLVGTHNLGDHPHEVHIEAEEKYLFPVTLLPTRRAYQQGGSQVYGVEAPQGVPFGKVAREPAYVLGHREHLQGPPIIVEGCLERLVDQDEPEEADLLRALWEDGDDEDRGYALRRLKEECEVREGSFDDRPEFPV